MRIGFETTADACDGRAAGRPRSREPSGGHVPLSSRCLETAAGKPGPDPVSREDETAGRVPVTDEQASATVSRRPRASRPRTSPARRRIDHVSLSSATVRTTFPVFCFVSTYAAASTTSSSG